MISHLAVPVSALGHLSLYVGGIFLNGKKLLGGALSGERGTAKGCEHRRTQGEALESRAMPARNEMSSAHKKYSFF